MLFVSINGLWMVILRAKHSCEIHQPCVPPYRGKRARLIHAYSDSVIQ
jgi:hypothetical protein